MGGCGISLRISIDFCLEEHCADAMSYYCLHTVSWCVLCLEEHCADAMWKIVLKWTLHVGMSY